MKRHPIPPFIPADVGLGAKTKLTVERSKAPVPPVEGLAYRKNPRNDSDTVERRRDAYFVGQLLAVYQRREFPRGNLDAGRLNRLWCDGILLVVELGTAAGDPEAVYRLDTSRAEALIEQMSAQ